MNKTCAARFKVLGAEPRLRIVECLVQRGPLCARALSRLLKIAPPAVARHLKALNSAGLIRGRGTPVHYEVNRPALRPCRKFLSKL